MHYTGAIACAVNGEIQKLLLCIEMIESVDEDGTTRAATVRLREVRAALQSLSSAINLLGGTNLEPSPASAARPFSPSRSNPHRATDTVTRHAPENEDSEEEPSNEVYQKVRTLGNLPYSPGG